jgi:hypothetical protein
METFDELDRLTQPVFIAPPVPACAPIPTQIAEADRNAAEATMPLAQVTILAQGTAGPYDYVVITNPDSDEMFRWLIENGYRITPAMRPLIQVYNDEGMVFLAMKLQPESGVQDIQPVVMTYESEMPMIPIRLTAVAANPNMNILTWIFADEQAFPSNFEHIDIADSELRGTFSGGGTNYMSLLDARIDEHLGLAMITEYAQPTSVLAQNITDPLLLELSEEHRYVTRFLGRMSPEEMTSDPVFNFDGQLESVSNIHDLSQMNAEVFWGCQGASLPKEGGIALALAGVVGLGFWRFRRKLAR